VKQGTSLRHLSLTALISILVLGVFALATEAKHSQYHSPQGTIQYLSKATKMDTCRMQHDVQAVAELLPESRTAQLFTVSTPVIELVYRPKPSPRSLRLDSLSPPSFSSFS
jgi:hypothetical protein